jgi:hypothetical protein
LDILSYFSINEIKDKIFTSSFVVFQDTEEMY